MKLLRYFIVTLFLLSASIMQAHQVRLTSEEKALVLTFRMSKYLQLTEPQKTEIMKIHQDAFDKMDLARQKFRDEKEMLKKSRKEIFETRDLELQKVLTKEQFDIFKQKQKDIQEKRKKEFQERKAARQQNKDNAQPVEKPTDNTPAPKQAPGKQ